MPFDSNASLYPGATQSSLQNLFSEIANTITVEQNEASSNSRNVLEPDQSSANPKIPAF